MASKTRKITLELTDSVPERVDEYLHDLAYSLGESFDALADFVEANGEEPYPGFSDSMATSATDSLAAADSNLMSWLADIERSM